MMRPFKSSDCLYLHMVLFVFKISQSEIWFLVEICFKLNLKVKGLKSEFV